MRNSQKIPNIEYLSKLIMYPVSFVCNMYLLKFLLNIYAGNNLLPNTGNKVYHNLKCSGKKCLINSRL